MITGVAICPPAPLLARELTGLDPVIPELRQACAAAAERLVKSAPEVIAVVGPGRRTAVWPADGRLNLAAFGPALGTRDASIPGLGGRPRAALPLPLGLGARLLDEAGYTGPRLLQSVHSGEPAAACLRLGADLRTSPTGSGCWSWPTGARAAACGPPATWTRGRPPSTRRSSEAVRSGDLGSLRAMDHDLARELLAAGRAGWQVLAGAMPGRAPSTEILYNADPFGVFYLVAWLAGE